MTAILRDASGKMHHEILFDPPLPVANAIGFRITPLDSDLSTGGPHNLFRLLFYSKCTGFTVCFIYSDVSLTMCINQ